ncbi:hypothetical protein [Burkholderia contaminans]|uniref:hypothetical protein n=1 Tax=Burkholderia contaminans TaxID=488447 RepID=UPI001589CD1E|nr:hypothetical protein [Burkholderia contaminans]
MSLPIEFTSTELETAYEAIKNDLGIEARFEVLEEILSTLESENYYSGEAFEKLQSISEGYVNVEFLIQVAEAIYQDCKENGNFKYEWEVIRDIKDDLREIMGAKDLLDNGFMEVDAEELIRNEISNDYGIEFSDNEYFYGDVSWQLSDFSSEWDSMDDSEKLEFLDDYVNGDIGEYVEENREQLEEEYGEDFDWEEASDEDKVKILLESDLLEVSRVDVYDCISHYSDINDENKFYLTAKMEDEIIDKDEMEERCTDIFLDAVSGGLSGIENYLTWDEEKVLDHATDYDQDGSYHYYIELGDGKYLAAGAISWNDDRDQTIYKTFVEANPEIQEAFPDLDNIDGEELVSYMEKYLEAKEFAENLDATLPTKEGKADKLVASINHDAETPEKKSSSTRMKV